jgi:hypothetical protein
LRGPASGPLHAAQALWAAAKTKHAATMKMATVMEIRVV